jgi:thiamine-phosphate pyrophosphorylase
VTVRVVLVTDRASCPIPAMLDRLAAILAAVPRGSVRVQVRDKALDGGPLLTFTRQVLAIARPRGAEVWVNDRADVAVAAGADGVHLPERGLAIADARLLGLPIGCSRHSVSGALAAARDGADLVQLGPIWATPSKAGMGEPLGLAALAVRLPVPLVAVGGIDSPERVRAARTAGADAVAVVRAAWTTPDPASTITAFVAAAS